MSRPAATATVRIDNDDTVATEWHFTPGAETRWHRHEMDYVIVPLSDGLLHIENAEGTDVAHLTHGIPYFRRAGVEHNVINAGDDELVFLEIELKPRYASHPGGERTTGSGH